MLDFGWMEFLIIMAVAVLVIGPREIPQLMYSLGTVMRRLHYLRYALSSQFEDFMAEAELRRNNTYHDRQSHAGAAEHEGAAPDEETVRDNDAAAADQGEEPGRTQ